MAALSADSLVLLDVARAVLGRCGGERWTVRAESFWCHVMPPGAVSRAHGWKLHISATVLSAPLVLARAAEVLVRHEVAFKFAADLDRVAELGDPWCDRGSSGKFITVYPRDDDQFRTLAWELHEATAGLCGPRILSDRQLRSGSLVYFRYGEFSGDRVFTDDGVFESRMTGPDGSTVKDERKAGFTPPSWASTPFPDMAVGVASKPTVLGGRFRVLRAIRHANKGGVYRAVDQHDGSEVVVKHARAHVGTWRVGSDVRDRLRDEARMLELLAPLSVAPAKIALFQEAGDVFLAQELVPGEPLYLWQSPQEERGGLGVGEATTMARRLVELLRTVHQAGYLVCDFKPHNVMVTPTGEVKLIDLEYLTASGHEHVPPFSRGFTAPEVEVLAQIPRARRVRVPVPADDCFSLGTSLFCMLTGLLPMLVSGRPGAMPSRRDLSYLLPQIALSHPVLEPFIELIAGLVDADPDQRWSLKQAEEFLLRLPDRIRALGGADTRTPSARLEKPVGGPLRQPCALDRLLADGITHLQRTMTPHRHTLWEPSIKRQAESDDPCNAWFGAAGVLATLTHTAGASGDQAQLETLAQAASWTDNMLFDVPRLLPGLCFGRAGTAWALHDAAILLSERGLASRAVELAKRLPTRWPSPDITHGLSGAGTAQLHLWQASGEHDLAERAIDCAEGVLAAARRDGDTWAWPIADDLDSHLAGTSTYGYAHGIAGTGTFLLAAAGAAKACGRPQDAHRYQEAAIGAATTLAAAARVDQGAASWPVAVGGPPEPHLATHWCSGPTGIGGFLIRVWAATGEQRFADLALQAATTVSTNPWRAPLGACCGLIGTAHYLLDLAEFTGQDQFRIQAEHITAVTINAQHSVQGDLHLPFEPEGGASYAWGASGILSLLARLQHGGPSPWMPPTSLFAGPQVVAAALSSVPASSTGGNARPDPYIRAAV